MSFQPPSGGFTFNAPGNAPNFELLSAQISQAEAAAKGKQEEIDKLRKLVGQMEQEYDEDTSQLMHQISVRQTAYRHQETMLAKANQKVKDTEQRIELYAKSIRDLHGTIRKKDRKSKELQESMTKLQKDFTKAEIDKKTSMQETSRIQLELENAIKLQNDIVRADNSRLASALDASQAGLETAAREQRALEEDLYRDMYEDSEKELEEKQSSRRDLGEMLQNASTLEVELITDKPPIMVTDAGVQTDDIGQYAETTTAEVQSETEPMGQAHSSTQVEYLDQVDAATQFEPIDQVDVGIQTVMIGQVEVGTQVESIAHVDVGTQVESINQADAQAQTEIIDQVHVGVQTTYQADNDARLNPIEQADAQTQTDPLPEQGQRTSVTVDAETQTDSRGIPHFPRRPSPSRSPRLAQSKVQSVIEVAPEEVVPQVVIVEVGQARPVYTDSQTQTGSLPPNEPSPGLFLVALLCVLMIAIMVELLQQRGTWIEANEAAQILVAAMQNEWWVFTKVVKWIFTIENSLVVDRILLG